MDNSTEGIILIATSMFALVAFALTVLAVMIIYRKRKIQHEAEIRERQILQTEIRMRKMQHEAEMREMNDKFARDLLERELEVKLQTMRHIGLEIHDDVLQRMTLAFHNLQYMISTSTNNNGIVKVANLIDEASITLRNLSKNLSNPDIMKKSFKELIDLEHEKIRNSEEFKVNYVMMLPEIEMSIETKGNTIRILQEFIQNSIRHAKCKVIDVCINHGNDGVSILASDNGKGFDVNKRREGIGLKSMQSRALTIQASLAITSSPGAGTTMKLVIPPDKYTVTNDAPNCNR